jgi:hypothetical protein
MIFFQFFDARNQGLTKQVIRLKVMIQHAKALQYKLLAIRFNLSRIILVQ